MSRILKRPMFRKGGSTNEGIMTGLVDRKGYANSNWDDIVADNPYIGEAYKAYSALEQPKDTSLYNMLIQGGLNLVSGAGAGGGTLSNIAKSYKGPSEKYMEAQAARQAFPSKMKMAAIQSGLEQDWAMELAREKNKQKDFFAAQTPEAQFEVRSKQYADSNIPPIRDNATNLATFEVQHRDKEYSQMRFKYDKKKREYVADVASVPVGFITYNPLTGLAYKRITRETNTFSDFIPLNPNTLEPLE